MGQLDVFSIDDLSLNAMNMWLMAGYTTEEMDVAVENILVYFYTNVAYSRTRRKYKKKSWETEEDYERFIKEEEIAEEKRRKKDPTLRDKLVKWVQETKYIKDQKTKDRIIYGIDTIAWIIFISLYTFLVLCHIFQAWGMQNYIVIFVLFTFFMSGLWGIGVLYLKLTKKWPVFIPNPRYKWDDVRRHKFYAKEYYFYRATWCVILFLFVIGSMILTYIVYCSRDHFLYNMFSIVMRKTDAFMFHKNEHLYFLNFLDFSDFFDFDRDFFKHCEWVADWCVARYKEIYSIIFKKPYPVYTL